MRRPLSHIVLSSAVVSVLATMVPQSALAQPAPVAASAAASHAAAEPAAVSYEVDGDASALTVTRDGLSAQRGPQIVRPLEGRAPVSDGFGHRDAPTAGASTEHQGVDFALGEGTPVRSIAAGTVTEVVSTDSGGCGISVRIAHAIDGQPVTTVYCHLLPGSLRVSQGQNVDPGATIAAVGNTGTSTGAHLHFEVRPGGGAAVDPLQWLAAHGV